jgi:nicotinamidase-related amidase
MEKSPHFEPDQSALLLIDHQVGTVQPIENITVDQTIHSIGRSADACGLLRRRQ